MQKWLALHSCVVVEHQEEYVVCRGPLGGLRDPSPTLRLPSPEFQGQEEEFL